MPTATLIRAMLVTQRAWTSPDQVLPRRSKVVSEGGDIMGNAMNLVIGDEVTSRDGVCGDLRRVVIDPVSNALTHLVVQPRHLAAHGHLVPVGLVDAAAETLTLRCSAVEFEALDDAEETRFLPGAVGQWNYGQEEMLSWPYYGLGMGGMGMGIGAGSFGEMGLGRLGEGQPTVTEDRVPDGEVEVRRGDHVHASDGDIGRVQGLVVDPRDHRITHVLLADGHLWGEKRIAIPISAVKSVTDGVRVSLSKNQIRDLPLVHIDDHR